ncbi:MAG: hypothetical protein RIR86_3138, partial [Acidobacteriota bacterium]
MNREQGNRRGGNPRNPHRLPEGLGTDTIEPLNHLVGEPRQRGVFERGRNLTLRRPRQSSG